MGTWAHVPLWAFGPFGPLGCFGRLGIEFRAFIASGHCDPSLDTRATLIDLASFTNWLPFDGRLRWIIGLSGSSGVVAMASEL